MYEFKQHIHIQGQGALRIIDHARTTQYVNHTHTNTPNAMTRSNFVLPKYLLNITIVVYSKLYVFELYVPSTRCAQSSG